MSLPANIMYSVLAALSNEKPGIHLTRKYSQGSPTDGLRNAYKDFGEKWEGACHALVRRWIVAHAYDIDFWHVMDGPNALAKFIAVRHVAREHIKFSKGYMRSDAQTVRWFQKRGLAQRDGITSGRWNQLDKNISKWSSSWVAGQKIADNVAPAKDGGSGWYTTISMWPKEGHGHTVGAFVGQDVLFFDPNYGEVWCETRELFRWWFPKFYNSSGY
jgi:hypothetical protein